MRKGNPVCRKGWSGVSLWMLAAAVIFGMASGAFAGIEPSPFRDISKPSKAGRPPAAQQTIPQQGQDPGTIATATAKPDLECTISVGTWGTETICGGTTEMKRGSVQKGSTIFDLTKTPCPDKPGKNTIVVIQGLKWNFKVKNVGPAATKSGKQIKVTRSISKVGSVENFPQETITEVLTAQGFKDYSYPPAGQLNPNTAPAGLYKADMTVGYEGEENNNYKGNNTCSHYFTLAH